MKAIKKGLDELYLGFMKSPDPKNRERAKKMIVEQAGDENYYWQLMALAIAQIAEENKTDKFDLIGHYDLYVTFSRKIRKGWCEILVGGALWNSLNDQIFFKDKVGKKELNAIMDKVNTIRLIMTRQAKLAA